MKQFYLIFIDVYYFFSICGETGFFSLLLNEGFCFIIHTVVMHCHFRKLRCIERILEAPLDLCVYVVDALYIVNKMTQ